MENVIILLRNGEKIEVTESWDSIMDMLDRNLDNKFIIFEQFKDRYVCINRDDISAFLNII